MASFREQGPTERFEKRKLFRFPVQLPAQIGARPDISSICTNLSTNGASFETAIKLVVGERVAVSVTIAPKEEPLRMVGQVMWKRALSAINVDSEELLSEVGVRFLRPLPSMERQESEEIEQMPMDEEEDEFLFPGKEF